MFLPKTCTAHPGLYQSLVDNKPISQFSVPDS